MSAVFPARYASKCAGCGERITVDEPVRFDDEIGAVVHDDCDDAAPAPQRPAVVCTTCWLTKPCECDAD